MLNLLIGWKEKAIAIGVAFLAVLGYIWNIKRKAKAEGKAEVITEINKQTQKTKDEWNKIDSTDLSVDDALSRLRQRSNRQDGSR